MKIKKFFPFIRSGMQDIIVYRSDFFLYRLGDIFGAVITYFLWQAIFSSSKDKILNGFTIQSMTIYIFLSFFTGIIIHSSGNESIGEEVKSGSIAIRILKPVSFEATYLFEEIGQKIMIIGTIFVPFVLLSLAYQIFNSDINYFKIVNIALYLFSSCIAYLLNFYFNVCFGFTAFIFKNLWGSNIMKNSIVAFMSGTLIPLSFFPETIDSILQVLPFSSLLYTPVMIYMNVFNFRQKTSAISLQIFWLIFFIILSKIIWKKTIKYLNIQGG